MLFSGYFLVIFAEMGLGMQCQNNATKIRREILIRILDLFRKGTLESEARAIPNRMYPKDQSGIRCCIYKDRAVSRLRSIAALGWGAEDDLDDGKSLNDYAAEALQRENLEGPVMTVLDIACKGCVNNRYYITDVCQGCLARPCMVNCPKDAITVVDGRSIIDPDKCIDCGKCKMVCPYNAVTKVSVPCEEACPVGAISKNKTGRATIDFEKCISCGRCMRSCPFGAVMEKSQVVDVARALSGKREVVAMVAPAIVGQFPGSLEQITAGLLELGFDRVVEVAQGADITTMKEAAEFCERRERGEPFMTTSCCPAYIQTVQKHIPELKKFVSETHTPMHYSACQQKQRNEDCITVFIGPCVAKRHEGFTDDCVDYVLTFEEVGAFLVAYNIEVSSLSGVALEGAASRQGRGFAVAGGVAQAVNDYASDNSGVQPVSIDGLSTKAITRLKMYASGKINNGNLIEVMACEGGCIAGPGAMSTMQNAARAIKQICAESADLEE